MKQLMQNYKTGKMEVAEVPPPRVAPGGVLVANRYSLISAGTERTKVEQARMSLIGKARSRPDQVAKVIRAVKVEGVATTWRKIQARLDQPTPLGYSTAGVVLDVGAEVMDFKAGDLVACAGAEYANHAEVIYVPHNLVAPIPEGVDLADAAYTTVGSIALHGVRMGKVQLGDNVMVIGLGLLGVISVQLLKAAGCRVIGVDVAPQRVEAAREAGADLALLRSDDVEIAAEAFTRGSGVDVVIITAGGDKNNDPIELAGEVTRDRGHVVTVGNVKSDLPRRTYYEKEISVTASRSYGPGRYDPLYEEAGIDYPIGYVRWTERENMIEFLRLIKDGLVRVKDMTTNTYAFDDALAAYDLLTGPEAAGSLGVLLKYEGREEYPRKVVVAEARPAGAARMGVIGVGNFCTGTLLPHLKGVEGVEMVGVADSKGLASKNAAEKFGFRYAASSSDDLMADPDINAVLIATRHISHAPLVCAALRAGKAAYVEKPLALNEEQLAEVVQAQQDTGGFIFVGHNRRYSPMVKQMAEFFAGRTGPLLMTYRVNAGPLDARNWMRATEEGGSRIISEGCHFIDAMMFLAGAAPVRVSGALPQGAHEPDTGHGTITFADGSVGTLTYVTTCDPSLPKERLEVFCDGKGAVLDNFRALYLYSGGKETERRSAGQDKGHRAEMQLLGELVRTGRPMPVPMDQLVALSLSTFAIIESAVSGRTIDLEPSRSLAPREVAAAT